MTDFRALCAELVEELAAETSLYPGHEREIVTRARAALAEPEPEGPTDEELLEINDRAYSPGTDEVNDEDDSSWQYTSDYIRWLDENGTPEEQGAYTAKGLRAVFKAGRRWGRPAPAPQPIPVTERLPGPLVDSEVAELVEWLNDHAYVLNEHGARIVRRAVDLLKQLPPRPISVTERLPGAEDCVVIPWSELRSPHVWAGKRRLINGPTEIWDWTFASIPWLEESGEFTHWLPASASVLPAGAIRQSNTSA